MRIRRLILGTLIGLVAMILAGCVNYQKVSDNAPNLEIDIEGPAFVLFYTEN